MTRYEIMEMAYEAGIEEAYSLQHDQVLVQFLNGSLERFAALVEAKASEKEREACAKMCDEAANVLCPEGKRINQVDTHVASVLRSKADTIRSRGKSEG